MARQAPRKPAGAFRSLPATHAAPTPPDSAPASRLGRRRLLWLLSAACGVSVIGLPLVGLTGLAELALFACLGLALVAGASR